MKIQCLICLKTINSNNDDLSDIPNLSVIDGVVFQPTNTIDSQFLTQNTKINLALCDDCIVQKSALIIIQLNKKLNTLANVLHVL